MRLVELQDGSQNVCLVSPFHFASLFLKKLTPSSCVIGNVDGQLQSAFTKLTNLHTKNTFSFAIINGNLFGAEDDDSVTDLLEGKIKVPVTSYFTVGTNPLPQRIIDKILKDEEICENLVYLGKRSTTKTIDGVKIVCLGGILDPTIVGGQSQEQHLPFHTADDVKALRGANSADILLTTMWPSLVWNGSKMVLPFDPATIVTSDGVADLCATLKPRYHFSPSTEFSYEREPFSHPPKDGATQEDTVFTRFVSLASYVKAKKNTPTAKSVFAFQLQSSSNLTPRDCTVSPFLGRSNLTRKRPPPDEGYSRFGNGNTHHDHRPHKRGRRDPPPGPEQCFLCLASERASSDMVVSIGIDTYLATAKGPLPTATTFAQYGLDFPSHMLIVPQEHVPFVSAPLMADGVGASTFAEMTRLRESMQAMVSTKSKQKLGAVTWEINKSPGIHAHWQFLPVPAELITKGLVEAGFRVEAENTGLPALVGRDFGISNEVDGDYVRIWIWCEEDNDDGGKIISKSLLMRFDENVRFDLQYPRKVMAKLMGLEQRTRWHDVIETEGQEKEDAEKFREAFKDWDFTLE